MNEKFAYRKRDLLSVRHVPLGEEDRSSGVTYSDWAWCDIAAEQLEGFQSINYQEFCIDADGLWRQDFSGADEIAAQVARRISGLSPDQTILSAAEAANELTTAKARTAQGR